MAQDKIKRFSRLGKRIVGRGHWFFSLEILVEDILFSTILPTYSWELAFRWQGRRREGTELERRLQGPEPNQVRSMTLLSGKLVCGCSVQEIDLINAVAGGGAVAGGFKEQPVEIKPTRNVSRTAEFRLLCRSAAFPHGFAGLGILHQAVAAERKHTPDGHR